MSTGQSTQFVADPKLKLVFPILCPKDTRTVMLLNACDTRNAAGRTARNTDPARPVLVVLGIVVQLAGRSVTVTEICWVSPPRSTVKSTRSPGSRARSAAMKSSADSMSWPLTAVMTSPGRIPAVAAGPSGTTSRTTAPLVRSTASC